MIATAVALLAAGHVVLVAGIAARTSMAFDEPAHIVSGYTYWTFGDYRLHPENGNWPQRLMALPLLGMDLAPPATDTKVWQVSDMWEVADDFFYGQGNPTDAMLWRARLPIALVSGLLAIGVFMWSSRLFGTAAGMLSLVLYATSATMLTHGGLATSDLLTAAMFLASLAAWWALLHRVTWRTVAISSVCAAGLVMSKHSAVLLLPVAAGLAGLRVWRGGPMRMQFAARRRLRGPGRQGLCIAALAAVHVALIVAVIWLSLGGRYRPFVKDVTGQETYYESVPEQLAGAGALQPVLDAALRFRLLPEAYVYGFAFVLNHASERSTFLAGDYSLIGWPAFFPTAFVLKTETGVLLLGVLGLALALWRRPSRDVLYRTAPLWAFAAVYLAASVTSKLNIGHRHLLPLYPVMFIALGGVWAAVRHRSMAWRAAVVALVVLSAGESLARWPHSLSFFNVLAGGPGQGYRHLVDSSLDWGQGLPALRRWLAERASPGDARTPVYLSYFGTARPEYHGIDARFVQMCSPIGRYPQVQATLEPGVYAISATNLQQVYLAGFGGWTYLDEESYRRTREVATAYFEADEAGREAMTQRLGSAPLTEAVRTYDALRFARLCMALRQREPDDMAGYSILIYRVSQAELDAALDGPPAELLSEPRIRGWPRPE